MFRDFKRKRCEKCKNVYRVGSLFCCQRYSRKWGLKLLYPLRLICFKFEKEE